MTNNKPMRCIECNTPLRVDEWWLRDKDATIVTCDHKGCAMEGYTLSRATYYETDFNLYMKRRKTS